MLEFDMTKTTWPITASRSQLVQLNLAEPGKSTFTTCVLQRATQSDSQEFDFVQSNGQESQDTGHTAVIFL